MEPTYGIVKFLERLSRHNNKEWFDAHREEYAVFKEFVDITACRFIGLVSEYEPRVRSMTPKQCTYRIFRDTRFSPDKTPYKTHVGIFVNALGKKSESMGWYLHLEPGGSFFAAGTGWSSPKVLKAIRQGIVAEIDDYRAIVESEEFKAALPELGMDKLKTAPKGFPKDWEFIEYLRPRMHGATVRLDDAMLTQSDWVEKLRPAVEQGARLNEFYNYFIYEALGVE